MAWEFWLRIIAQVLLLIAEGMSKEEAAGSAAKMFGTSAEEIFRRGGF